MGFVIFLLTRGSKQPEPKACCTVARNAWGNTVSPAAYQTDSSYAGKGSRQTGNVTQDDALVRFARS